MYDSYVDTLLHIKRVNELLLIFIRTLLDRAAVHDQSKLEEPEKSEFDKLTPLLSSLVYGSKEYKASLDKLNNALDHHYKNNSHHPQYYVNGIDGMDLADIVEMFFDWKAATERVKDGSIEKSISLNTERFNMSEQLKNIFLNTAERYGWLNKKDQ